MGADIGAKDKRGISALHYASCQGRLEVLQFLWSKGLELDADDPGAASLPTLAPQKTHLVCSAAIGIQEARPVMAFLLPVLYQSGLHCWLCSCKHPGILLIYCR